MLEHRSLVRRAGGSKGEKVMRHRMKVPEHLTGRQLVTGSTVITVSMTAPSGMPLFRFNAAFFHIMLSQFMGDIEPLQKMHPGKFPGCCFVFSMPLAPAFYRSWPPFIFPKNEGSFRLALRGICPISPAKYDNLFHISKITVFTKKPPRYGIWTVLFWRRV